MKATEQYFPVVLFIKLLKVSLTIDSVNKSYTTTIHKNDVKRVVKSKLFSVSIG